MTTINELRVQEPGWCYFTVFEDDDPNEYCDLQDGIVICKLDTCPLYGKVIAFTVKPDSE